jgi:hypothetical protein
MLPSDDPRTLRLYDMRPRDVLTVQCTCGPISRFAAGELQRKSRRVFSDMPIWDLQYRLRCQHCRRTKGMRIILWDGEPSGIRDPHDAGPHIVIVEGEVSERVRL